MDAMVVGPCRYTRRGTQGSPIALVKEVQSSEGTISRMTIEYLTGRGKGKGGQRQAAPIHPDDLLWDVPLRTPHEASRSDLRVPDMCLAPTSEQRTLMVEARIHNYRTVAALR